MVNGGYHRAMSTGLGQRLALSFPGIISPLDEAEPRFRWVHIDNKAQRGEPEIVTTYPDPLLTAGHGNAEANCRTSVWTRGRSCAGW